MTTASAHKVQESFSTIFRSFKVNENMLPNPNFNRLDWHGLRMSPSEQEIALTLDEYAQAMASMTKAEQIVFDAFGIGSTDRIPSIGDIASRCGDVGFSESRVSEIVQSLIGKRLVCRRSLRIAADWSIDWYQTAPIIDYEAFPSQHPARLTTPASNEPSNEIGITTAGQCDATPDVSA